MLEIKHKETGKRIICVKHDSLRGRALNGLDLTGADLKGHDLSACKFISCNLSDCDFSAAKLVRAKICLLYTSPSPRDLSTSRMPSSA